MGFLDSIKNGWTLFKSANKVFAAYPKLIVPILITWAIMAPLILYLKFFFNPRTGTEALLIFTAFIVGVSILITMSCSIVLELIEQHESGKKMSLIKAGMDSWFSNFSRILPLAIVYAFVWFVIAVITALLSRKNSSSKSYSAENAARSLGGADGSFSLLCMGLQYILKALRMVMFLILPAICWEGKGTSTATKRGWQVLKNNKMEFISGFFLTEAAATLVFLPPALLFYITKDQDIKLSDMAWYGVMVYIGMAWSYCIYLEQIFTAELFLWYKKWEQQNQGRDPSLPALMLKDVEKPSLLDDILEFAPESLQKEMR